MSFATASCDLWQNEQRSDSSEPRDVFIVSATPGVGPVVLGTSLSLHRTSLPPMTRKSPVCPFLVTPEPTLLTSKQTTNPGVEGRGVLCLESARPYLRARPVNDVVDDAVLLRLLRRHDEVAFHVALDAVQRLPCRFAHQLVGDLADAQNLARVDVDVSRLPAQPAHRRLMDQDARVG